MSAVGIVIILFSVLRFIFGVKREPQPLDNPVTRIGLVAIAIGLISMCWPLALILGMAFLAIRLSRE